MFPEVILYTKRENSTSLIWNLWSFWNEDLMLTPCLMRKFTVYIKCKLEVQKNHFTYNAPLSETFKLRLHVQCFNQFCFIPTDKIYVLCEILTRTLHLTMELAISKILSVKCESRHAEHTLRLEPMHRITSALSATWQAIDQFRGQCNFPRSPKCTIVSTKGPRHE